MGLDKKEAEAPKGDTSAYKRTTEASFDGRKRKIKSKPMKSVRISTLYYRRKRKKRYNSHFFFFGLHFFNSPILNRKRLFLYTDRGVSPHKGKTTWKKI